MPFVYNFVLAILPNNNINVLFMVYHLAIEFTYLTETKYTVKIIHGISERPYR